jgi:hypothetical protein
MPDRERALRDALEAGINVLKENFGDDYDRALVLQNVPLLLEVMWPFIEGYHENYAVDSFEEQFAKRFPNHVLVHYGGSVLEYIVGNVQTAVTNEIILMMETWAQTMHDAQENPRFNSTKAENRDWAVGRAHVQELISEVKQYRTRGARGSHPAHTGTVAIPTQPQE